MSQCGNKAQVVYYLSRAGKLEPPHMIEVPISSPDGLRLADVKQRLTALRGNAMPNMFSWSYKRLYKSTHIWQDVSDEDSLTPVQSGEYILKGSEYLEKSQDIKVMKPAMANGMCENVKGGGMEALQRKYRGAENWLKAPDSMSPKEPQPQPITPILQVSRSTSTVECSAPPAPASNRRDEQSKGSSSAASDESSSQNFSDIKVYELRSSAAGAAIAEHVCDVGTQTEPSSTSCSSYASEKKVVHQIVSAAKEEKKASKGRRKLKHPSCMLLHILSYCGGVDTKTQGTSSEAAFSECSSYQDSQEHPSIATPKPIPPNCLKTQICSNRLVSEPLVQYSSEFFDIKEAVTANSSPVHDKSSADVSRCSSFSSRASASGKDLDDLIDKVFGKGSKIGRNLRTAELLEKEVEPEPRMQRNPSTRWLSLSLRNSLSNHMVRDPSLGLKMMSIKLPKTHRHPWKNSSSSKRGILKHCWQATFQVIQTGVPVKRPRKVLYVFRRQSPRKSLAHFLVRESNL